TFVAQMSSTPSPSSATRRARAGGHSLASTPRIVSRSSRCSSVNWPALALPESVGGLGYGWVELGILLEEMGEVAAPGPLLATTTQFAPAVLRCGTPDQADRFLRPVAAGEATGALAVDEGDGASSLTDVEARGTVADGKVTLTGRKRLVQDGADADEVAVAVRIDDELRVVVVPGSEVEARRLEPVDPTIGHAELDLDGATVDADRVLGAGDATSGLVRALEERSVGLSLTTLGACTRIFEMTLAYAKEREQFDVPIGSFQAVKHKLADMYADREKAAALCHFAALCLAEDDDRRTLAARLARTSVRACRRRMVKEGLQLHGGIGYTWEHDLQLHLRRAQATGLSGAWLA
ncbi:MAG: acyl-CoA dehydrogenase, partial [Actinomycetota bacterium]